MRLNAMEWQALVQMYHGRPSQTAPLEVLARLVELGLFVKAEGANMYAITTAGMDAARDIPAGLDFFSTVHLSLVDLRRANHDRRQMFDPEDNYTPEFSAIELVNEFGELMGEVKKMLRTKNGMVGGKSGPEAREALRDEFADVLICLDLFAQACGVDLAAATARKFNKTSAKHNMDVFLPEAA